MSGLTQYFGRPYDFGLLGMQNHYFGQSQQAMQHSEVMGALRDLGKNTITVCVSAAAIAPLCVQALATLEPEARDYEASLADWNRRIAKVREWQKPRKIRNRARSRRRAEDKLTAERYPKFRRWYRSAARAMKLAREDAKDSLLWRESYRSAHYHDQDQFCRSRPRPPKGYADLPAIRDLQSAASISSDAQLTVPVETIKKLARWSQ